MGVHFLFLLHEEFLSDMFDILCTGPNRSDSTYDRLNISKLLHLSSSKIIKNKYNPEHHNLKTHKRQL